MQDPVIQPGVAAIVFDSSGCVLLHRRRDGGWAPPSGRIEVGESVSEAIERELLEETNLSVQIRRLVGIYSDPVLQTVEYPGGKRVHFITALFECQVAGGNLRGSSEGLEWGWFSLDGLPDGLLPYAGTWLSDAASGQSSVFIR